MKQYAGSMAVGKKTDCEISAHHCPEEIESTEKNCEDNTIGGKHNKSRQNHETDHEGDECPGQDRSRLPMQFRIPYTFRSMKWMT